MYLIAHRGNIFGPNSGRENTENYILECLELGYDCEIDVWVKDDQIFLGHDGPAELTSIEFILEHKDRLWIHCKNFAALERFVNDNCFNCFFHDKDDYTITSKGIVWGNIDSKCISNMICVMPEKYKHKFVYPEQKCIGVCSDYIHKYKSTIDKIKL